MWGDLLSSIDEAPDTVRIFTQQLSPEKSKMTRLCEGDKLKNLYYATARKHLRVSEKIEACGGVNGRLSSCKNRPRNFND